MMLKVGIAYAIPDVPAWVEKEMAKIEYRRREAEKSISNVLIGPASPGSSQACSIDTEDRGIQTDVVQAVSPSIINCMTPDTDLSAACSRYPQRFS